MKYLLIVFTIAFSLNGFSQPEKLTGLDTVMSKLYYYHISNPTTKIFVNNISREIEKVFNVELENNFMTLDSVLENISHHLPYFDSILKANNINVAVDIYLSDLLLNSLDSSISYSARAKYKTDGFCRYEPLNLIRNKDRELIIEMVNMSSFSSEVSIKKGDRIISINDIPARFLTNGVIKNLFHKTDTLYTVFERPDSAIIEIIIPTIIDCKKTKYSLDLQSGGTGILTFFDQELNTTNFLAIKNELKKHKKNITKLIIDFRNFSGGTLNETSGFIDIFFEKNIKLFDVKFNNPEWNKEFYSVKSPIFKETKVFFLINNQTSSAANIICNVFQHNMRASVIGEESDSHTYIQTFEKINGSQEYYIFFPTAFVYLPNHDTPIKNTIPDVMIKDSQNDEDLILEYAIKN